MNSVRLGKMSKYLPFASAGVYSSFEQQKQSVCSPVLRWLGVVIKIMSN